MRPHKLLVLLAMLSVASAALAQKLDCPAPTSTGRPCDAFHYHVLVYRPDTRGFAELYGTNQFASLSACERSRSVAVRTNLAVVDFFKRVRNEQQYEPDRFGSCHCDMTIDKASPNYLTDAARVSQIRLAEDIRLHIRERLMNADLGTDSELVRSLASPLSTNQLLGGPKLVPLPAKAPATNAEIAASDLRSTKLAEAGKTTMSSLDLPLVDVAAPSPALFNEPATAPAPAPVAVAPARVAASTGEAAPAPASSAEGTPDAAALDEAAENFITYETSRIQNVLKASSVIADEMVKARIFEACMQRIQLLSNLRRLIQGSGMRSRLAGEARTVRSEGERQALIARLFGKDITKHWAPKDAADVILEPLPDVDADADRVLRDASGRYSVAQKKRALYIVLAKSQPTEDQQLWLTTLVDSFLQ
jgi:hypothetical protein